MPTCNMRKKTTASPCTHYLKPDLPTEPGFCKLSSRFRCDEALKQKLPAITQSAVKSFAQCKAKYKHNYIDGIAPHDWMLPEPIKLGATWDAYQESIHTPHNPFKMEKFKEKYHLQPNQIAKITALINAFTDLGLKVSTDCNCQHQVKIPIGPHLITGYLDRVYPHYIVETKLSSRPDFHTDLHGIYFQCGTYLMDNPAWTHVDMEVTRLPGLKTGYGKTSNESTESYTNRIYSDIIKQPSYYFIGYDRSKKTFGKRFWRAEFDLKSIFKTYSAVLRDIRFTIDNDLWFPNTLSCLVPTTCQYYQIMKTGVISDDVYKNIDKKGGMR